jgi:hypothetical protein
VPDDAMMRPDKSRYEGKILVVMPRQKFVGLVGGIPAWFKGVIEFVSKKEYLQAAALVSQASLVITHSYLSPRANYFILQARTRGIPTLLLVDGPLEWSNSYLNPSLRKTNAYFRGYMMEPLIHDAILAVSAAQAGYLAFRNPDRGITFMTYNNKRLSSVKSTASSAGRWQFLITTAKTPYFDDTEKNNLVHLLTQLTAALEQGGYSYVFRIFDNALQEALSPKENLLEGSFEEVLQQVECVIGTPSSVLLQSMASDKPVGTLIYRDSPLFYQSGWLVGGLCSLDATLASMLCREDTRMDFQTYCLEQNISQQDFFTALDGVVKQQPDREKTTENLQTLRFENSILRSLLESPLNFNPGYYFHRIKRRFFSRS